MKLPLSVCKYLISYRGQLQDYNFVRLYLLIYRNFFYVAVNIVQSIICTTCLFNYVCHIFNAKFDKNAINNLKNQNSNTNTRYKTNYMNYIYIHEHCQARTGRVGGSLLP